MVDVLKPCPFCGGEAEIERRGDRRQSTIYSCTECSCSLETGEEWDYGRDWNRRSTLSDAVAEREAEPLAWQRRRKYPSVWGEVPQWEQCSGNEANDQFKRSSYHEYRPLYTSPPTSELEALRKRVAELEKALEPFADIADLIEAETEGMSETDELKLHFHDYLMASWPVAMFRIASRVREGGKVE